MFRKIDLKILNWVFLGLLVMTVLVKVLDNSRGVNTLKSVLFDFDDDVVTSIVLKPRMLNGERIELKQNKENWNVLVNGKSYNGDVAAVKRLIHQLNGLEPIRLASQDKDRWQTFELTDSLATEVRFIGAKGELARIYIGKFSYSQARMQTMMPQNPYQRPQGTMVTYVRCNDEKEVYAVEGFLANAANRKADAFRDKTLLKTQGNNIHKIAFSYPADSSFTMVENQGQWICDGLELDSASVAEYLSDIVSLRGSNFVNELGASATHIAKIYSKDGEMLEVKALIKDNEAILMSSQNPGTVFKESLSLNFNKLFVSKHEFLK